MADSISAEERRNGSGQEKSLLIGFNRTLRRGAPVSHATAERNVLLPQLISKRCNKKLEKSGSIEGQSDIVFGKRGGRGARTGDVVQFGEMDVVRVTVFVGKAMEHGSHPPGEA